MAAVARTQDRPGGELDEVTLRLAQRGDRSAQRRFIEHYAPTVFAFLSRLGIPGAVEDAAQETMVGAIRSLPRFDPAGPAKLSTWLLTIASRTAARVRTTRPTVPLVLDLPAPASASPEAHARALEIRRRAKAVVDGLAPELREAFVLAEAHGLTPSEIAEVQAVPPATARTRLHRARERIRAALLEADA